MSTFQAGQTGAFPMIEDNCKRLQDALLETKKRMPQRIQLGVQDAGVADIPADACLGQSAVAALTRQDKLEEELALNYCRQLAGGGKEKTSPEPSLSQAAAQTLRIPPRHPVPRHKRLWRKFRENPRKYLADSRNPLLRGCRHLFKRKK